MREYDQSASELFRNEPSCFTKIDKHEKDIANIFTSVQQIKYRVIYSNSKNEIKINFSGCILTVNFNGMVAHVWGRIFNMSLSADKDVTFLTPAIKTTSERRGIITLVDIKLIVTLNSHDMPHFHPTTQRTSRGGGKV